MQNTVRLLVFFSFLFGLFSSVHPPAGAQEIPGNALIQLSVQNEALGDVLHRIAEQTGCAFQLDPAWSAHRISATIDSLPLEQGLNRVLKSLNHTIVWESERFATIVIYGEVEADEQETVSFAAPPHPEPAPDVEPLALELDEEPEPEEEGETPVEDNQHRQADTTTTENQTAGVVDQSE